MEIENIPNKELNLVIIKMLNKLGMNDHSEKFHIQLENIKGNQIDTKNTMYNLNKSNCKVYAIY